MSLKSNIPYIGQQYTLYWFAIYPILLYGYAVKMGWKPCDDSVAEALETFKKTNRKNT